jgi:hypothetical protein
VQRSFYDFTEINEKKGADLPKSSSFTLGHDQETFTHGQDTAKSTSHTGHETFRILVLMCLKIGRIQSEENKS